MDYLNRKQAPFGDELWKTLDESAVEAARDILTARRFLEVEGPFGVGLTSIEVGGDEVTEGAEDTGLVVSRALAVPMLRKSFTLSVRRLAAHLEHGQPLDVSPVEDAAEGIACAEEKLLYYGDKRAGIAGLLTADGRTKVDGGDWSDVNRALKDVLAAVNALGKAGFRGPYALALSPEWYNSLYRLYDGTDMLQLKHFSRIFTRGVFKAPIEGGAVLDPRAATLIVGQDLRVGYASGDGTHHGLFMSESLVLRIDDAAAICTIGGRAKK